jgi:hypothetical protein
MAKEDIMKVTAESIHLEELGAEGSGAGHTTSEDGDKKDAREKEEAPSASLGNFFVSTQLPI